MSAASDTPPSARQWTVALSVAALALGLSAALRYRVVEPADVSAFCGAVGSGDLLCVLRSAVVALFSQQRLGWLALGLSILALWARQRNLALLALATACAGLMLYCTRYAAPAALLAALALLPAWRAAGTAGDRAEGDAGGDGSLEDEAAAEDPANSGSNAAGAWR